MGFNTIYSNLVIYLELNVQLTSNQAPKWLTGSIAKFSPAQLAIWDWSFFNLALARSKMFWITQITMIRQVLTQGVQPVVVSHNFNI